MRYDPNFPIDEEQWSDRDESEQIDLVVDYHRRAGEKLSNLTAHAGLHVVVENQVLMKEEIPISAALGRLMDEGLDRHDAIHAIASVLSMTMFDAVNSRSDDDISARYFREVADLTAAKWRLQAQ
jgi:hypothetical protein